MRHKRPLRGSAFRSTAHVLQQLGHAVAAMQPLAEIAQLAATTLRRYCGLRHVLLVAVSEAHSGQFGANIIGAQSRLADAPALRELLWPVVERREPQLVPESSLADEPGLALPLLFAGSVIGILFVSPVARARRYERLLRAAADLLAAALFVHLNAEILELTLAEQSTTLASIGEIAQQLNATLDRTQIVEHVLFHALTLPAAASGLVLLPDAAGTLTLSTHQGVADAVVAALTQTPPSLADFTAFDLNQEYQSAVVERFPPQLQIDRFAGEQVVLPLLRDHRLSALLLLASRPRSVFSPTQLRFLKQLAAHGSLALSNAAAYSAIEEQRRLLDSRFAQLQAVAHISQAISAHLHLGALLREIVNVVQSTLGYRTALLSLVEPHAPDQVRRAAAVGIPEDRWQVLSEQVVPLANYEMLMAEDFRVSRSFYIAHDHRRATDSRLMQIVEQGYRPDLGARSADQWNADDMLLVPLYGHQGGLVGILSVDDPADQRRPTAETVAVLEIFATQAATAIENARMYAELERQALTDNLTGLANQRHFMLHLVQQLSLASRHGHPLVLLALDIDHFKSFNDEYGHLAGNVVLREFADILRRMVRLGDHVARWGGEEFLALLPESTPAGSIEVAERIRLAVEQHSFAHRPITVSIGIATFRPGMSDHDLLAAADAALYRAKTRRNTVAS